MKLLQAARELGVIAGVLWHQGEADSSDRHKAETYVERLKTMVRDLRKDLGIPALPFVVGQIGPFVEANSECPYASIVNRQIIELDRHIDHVRTITSAGATHVGDALHLDTRSQILMGERYALKMIELLTH